MTALSGWLQTAPVTEHGRIIRVRRHGSVALQAQRAAHPSAMARMSPAAAAVETRTETPPPRPGSAPRTRN